MAYGAEYIYGGMSNMVPNAVNTYYDVTADKRARDADQRARELEEQKFQNQLGLIKANFEAEEQAGNQVLYAGQGMQPQRVGAMQMGQSPQRQPSQVPASVMAKNDSTQRLLGAGGLGAPTYGNATPDNPDPSQAYKKPIGPSDAGRPDDLRTTLKNYHMHRLKMKEKALAHADETDIAQDYTKTVQQLQSADKSSRLLQLAIKKAQAGDPEALQLYYGTEHDLNDPAEMDQAMEKAMAEIAQLVAQKDSLEQERLLLEPKRQEFGIPAFANDFEAAQWMRQREMSKPTIPSSKPFTPSSQMGGSIMAPQRGTISGTRRRY